MSQFNTMDHPRGRDGKFVQSARPAVDGMLADSVTEAADDEVVSHEVIPNLICDPTAERIAAGLEDAGHDVVIVGGPVRDALLEREPSDIDLATSALPNETRRVLHPLGSVYNLGEEYGTIAVNVDGAGDYEVTTYRGDEQYAEGSRHPEVTLGVSLETDLSRRDFTVNAMAWRPSTGELVDPYGGRDDLDAGILRTPLDPDVTFQEDPLRIPRAVRFSALNNWQIEPATLSGAQRNADRVAEVARERRTAELRKVLNHPDRQSLARAIERSDQIGCTRHLFGQIDTTSVTRLDHDQIPPEHRLGALVHAASDRDAAAAELRALKFTNNEVAEAKNASDAAVALRSAQTHHEARAAVRSFDDRALAGAVALNDASGAPARPSHVDAALADRDRIRSPLPVNGNDLVQAGFKGRAVGDALRRVERAFLDDPNLDRNAAMRAATA